MKINIINKKQKKTKLLVNSLLIIFFFISCKETKLPDFVTGLNDTTENQINAPIQALKKVRFLPNWNLNSQFAAYYVGKELGFYKKKGIDLDILTYFPTKNLSEEFKKIKPDFSVLWLSNALELNDKNNNLVNIAQFSNKSSIMMVTKKKSKINTLKDFNNKKAAIWSDFVNQAEVFFKQNNLNVEVVPISNSLNIFYNDGVEIVNANYFDEFHSIINSGYKEDELNFFFLADYNFNLLEDGLYCNNILLKNDPKLCRNFVKATIESWEYVFKHKTESIDIIEKVMKANKKAFNRAHQIWMLNRFEEIYKDGIYIRTYLSEKDYNLNTNILLKGKSINKIIPYNDFFQPFSFKSEKE